MAPASFKKMGAAVACATAVRGATSESYQLSEEYTADNFFDKFDFFTSTYTSGNSWDATHGYVQYRGKAEAESLGLISAAGGHVYIGPDTNSTYDPDGTGRDSVRMTSKAVYNGGLMIAQFSHMPVQACGAWPAFWSFGSPWLTQGEIDFYEGWNEMGYNRMAMHTNKTLGGECSLTTTAVAGTVETDDCNNGEDMAGCGVQDTSGVWGSTTGATFAMEWTDAAIKLWSWVPTAVPADITAGAPDPTFGAWGHPTLLVEQTNCDLGQSFANQQLVFNIDFCGDSAGSPTFWNQTCSAQVGDSCANYVANNPAAFAETYFVVEGIQYYEWGVAASAVSDTTSAAAVVPAPTNIVAGIVAGTGSVPESTTLAAAVTASPAAATEVVLPEHHTTSYIYGTSTATDDVGAETTVVVVVDTTICPVTATEAPASSALASGSASSVVAAAQTTPAAVTNNPPASSPGPWTVDVDLTTSTVFSLSSSTITACAATASTSCNVGDITTVIIAVSTTICPVTATQASSSTATHSPVPATGSASVPTGIPLPASSGRSTTGGNSPVQATGSSGGASSPTAVSSQSTVSVASAAKPTLSTVAGSASVPSTTTPPATVAVISATDTGGDLEMATASGSGSWLTAAATAAASASNGTSTSASSSASQTNSCSGLDCIVVSSGGSRADDIGASAFALVVLAGAMILF